MADILAGYDVDLNAQNGDAQIGAVAIGADWISSNLVTDVPSAWPPIKMLAIFAMIFGDVSAMSTSFPSPKYRSWPSRRHPSISPIISVSRRS